MVKRTVPGANIPKIVAQLHEAREETSLRIASAKPGSYTAAQLRHTKLDIERMLAEYGFPVPDPSAPESEPMLGRISDVNLEVAEAHVARESGISSDAARRIEGVLRRAQIGGQPMSEITAQMRRAIWGDDPGRFSEKGQLAEKITYNELHKITGAATQKRLEELAERQVGYNKVLGTTRIAAKEWRCSVGPQKCPRPGHVALNGKVIAVAEKFTDEVTGQRLLFPGDPDADPSATDGCGCFLLPAFLPYNHK